MTVNNNLENISSSVNNNFSLQEVFNKNAKETISNLVTETNILTLLTSLLTKTNENVVSLVKGNLVYSSSLNNVDKAQANSINTSKVLGMVTNSTVASNATTTIQNTVVFAFDNTTQVDAIANTTGGFRVRFGVALNDSVIWFHTYKHSNTVNGIMMLSPNQCIRTEIRSTTGSGSITTVCADVSTEGSNNDIVDTGIQRSINTGVNPITVATAGTFYALLGIRLKPTHKDISVLIEKLSILDTSNDNFLYELRLNPTVAGTFTYSDVTDSSIQRAIGTGTNTVTGGTVLSSGLQQQQASANISAKNSLRLGSTIAGVMDTFVLCVSPLSNTMTIHAAMDIRELF